MDTKKIIVLVLVVAVAAVACLMAFTSGPSGPGDNIVELDRISFNTTNATDFVKTNERNDSAYNMSYYASGNGTGECYVNVLKFNDGTLKDSVLNAHKNFPSENVNGVVVYTESGSTGEDVSDVMYVSIVEGDEVVIVGSPDAGETAKMASTMRFS